MNALEPFIKSRFWPLTILLSFRKVAEQQSNSERSSSCKFGEWEILFLFCLLLSNNIQACKKQSSSFPKVTTISAICVCEKKYSASQKLDAGLKSKEIPALHVTAKQAES